MIRYNSQKYIIFAPDLEIVPFITIKKFTIMTKKFYKTLPHYGDIICRKAKINGCTFIIGLALPDGIDVRYPCYYLYRFNRSNPFRYDQIVGHPDVSYIYQYLVRHYF